MSRPLRLAVLASGTGTNLQAILDTVHGRDGVEVVVVASDKPGAPALRRAESAGVATRIFAAEEFDDRAARDDAMAAWLEERDIGLVVLAGYMQLLTPAFISRFANRIVNVHPALLPAFPGLGSIEQAVEHGVKVAGVTVHFVDEGVDSGPIVLQEAFELPYHADIATIEQHFHEVEHRLLPRAVRLIAAGAVRVDATNPRLVHVTDLDLEPRADG